MGLVNANHLRDKLYVNDYTHRMDAGCGAATVGFGFHDVFELVLGTQDSNWQGPVDP